MRFIHLGKSNIIYGGGFPLSKSLYNKRLCQTAALVSWHADAFECTHSSPERALISTRNPLSY